MEIKQPPLGELLPVAAAARLLGVSPRTIDRLVVAGRIPQPIRLSAKRMWPADELRAALAAAPRGRHQPR